MTTWTYATLTQAIQDWTENDATEFTDKIDEIIGLAELRIEKEVPSLPAFRKASASTISLTSGATTVTAPSDIVAPRWLRIQNGAYLLQKNEDFIRTFQPATGTNDGSPRFYAWSEDGSTNLLIGPAADANYTLEIGYTYRPTGLSSGNTTSWLGTNAPDVLLYACLIESLAFMKHEAQGQENWQKLYDRALMTLKDEEVKRRHTDEYRAGL